MLPEIGKLHETGDPWEPYRLMDPAGSPVEPVTLYFKGRRRTVRSPAFGWTKPPGPAWKV